MAVILPNAAPDKSAHRALSQIYRQTILGYFRHERRLSCIRKKPDDLQSIANLIRFFNLRHNFSRPQGIRIQKNRITKQKGFWKNSKNHKLSFVNHN